MKNKTLNIILGVIIAFIIVYFLLIQISINDITNTLRESNKIYLLYGFLIYIIMAIGRAIRFKVVSKLDNLKDTFSIVCTHNFLNNILPLKTGELSYPAMIKRKFKIPFSNSLADLAIIRFFDLISIAIILIVSILFSYKYFNNFLIFSISALIFILVLYTYFYSMGKRLLKHKTNIKNKCLKNTVNFIKLTLSKFSQRSQKEIIFLFFSSLIIYSLMFVTAFIIIESLGLNAPLFLIAIGGSLSMLATLLPIQSPLNLGTTEIGFVIPFVIYGIPKEQAISVSFSYHIYGLLFALLLFFIGIITALAKSK